MLPVKAGPWLLSVLLQVSCSTYSTYRRIYQHFSWEVIQDQFTNLVSG